MLEQRLTDAQTVELRPVIEAHVRHGGDAPPDRLDVDVDHKVDVEDQGREYGSDHHLDIRYAGQPHDQERGET